MLMEDYQDPNNQTYWNQVLNKISQTFVILFTIECILKIISQGLIMHQNSYIRDFWNWMDLAVVLTGLLEMSNLPGADLKSVRALRVLRVLRSIKAFPDMKKLIQGMIDSLPSLMNAFFFMLFVYLNFAIFGVQQFNGAYYNRCRSTPKPTNDTWPYSGQELCSSDPNNGRQCPENQFCGEWKDSLIDMDQIDFGFTNFDNLFQSMITVFQIITLEGWSKIMYNLLDQQSQSWIVPMFFISLVLLGSLFLLNVVLAIFGDAFDKMESQIELKKNVKKMLIAKSVNRLKNRLNEEEANILREKLQLQIKTEMNIIKSKRQDEEKKAQERKESESKLFRRIISIHGYDQTFSKRQSNLQINQDSLNVLTNPDIEATVVDQEAILNTNNKMCDEESKQEIPFPQVVELQQQDYVTYNLSTFLRIKQIRVPIRAYKNRCYFFSYLMLQRPGFNFIMLIITFTNCLILALDRYPLSFTEMDTFDKMNIAMSFIFGIEMIIKLFGLGVKEYSRDGFNLFDAFIVALSIIDFSLYFVSGSGGAALNAFRAIRILRIFKLSKGWKAFNIILTKILKSIKDIMYFVLLLVVFIVVFTILGLEFWSQTVFLDEKGNLTTQELGKPPLANFESQYNALVTVFALTMGDGWNQIYYQYARYNYHMATFYFFAVVIITNVILLSLFLALIINNFSKSHFKDEDDEDLIGFEKFKLIVIQRKNQFLFMTQQILRKICCCYKDRINFIQDPKTKDDSLSIENELMSQKTLQEQELNGRLNSKNMLLVKSMLEKNKKLLRIDTLNFKKNVIEGDQGQNFAVSIANITKEDLIRIEKQKTSQRFDLQGKSLFVFGPLNILRIKFAQLVFWKHFENLTTVAIIISTITLSLDNPLNDPTSLLNIVVDWINIIMTIIFTIEAITKIIVSGFLFNGKKSYLRSVWNFIDFLTVAISLVSFAFSSNISFFKTIRMIRFLRPLRLVQKNSGLRIAVQSLINAMPGILNLSIICLCFLIIFAILGVNLFKGSLYLCKMDNIPKDQRQLVVSFWTCLDYGGEWPNSVTNFDNIFEGLKTQFLLMTKSEWYTVYQLTLNYSPSYYDMPLKESSRVYILYYVLSLFVSALYILNMFVGVVITTFQTEKEKLSHSQHLTKIELDYIDSCILCYQAKPTVVYTPTGSKLKDYLRQLALKRIFDIFIFTCILVNSLVLMLQWYQQSDKISKALDTVNHVLTVIFTLEFIIKVIGFGFQYFYSPWNIVDFIVVITSWIDFILGIVLQSGVNSAVKIVRTFRVARILKLIKRFKELQRILMTFIEAIPALINVGGLLFLFIYLFAVLGVQFFSNIKLQGTLNTQANFQTFGSALLTLFRVTTGEGWNDMMEDCARERSIDFQCYEQTYQQQQLEGMQGCGVKGIARLYFMFYQVFVSFIMLNLFIAIILEAFQNQLNEEARDFQPETIDRFIEVWKEFDPTGSGLINIDDLELIVMQLVKSEQKIQDQTGDQKSVYFGFNQSRMLRLYSHWFFKEDDESIVFKDIQKSVRLQRQLARNMNKFLGDLMIPTYQRVTKYYFHDVLLSFVKFQYSQKFKHQFKLRKQRIQNITDLNQELTGMDAISPDSKEYQALSQKDKQIFNELNSAQFNDVIKSVEEKGNRTDQIIMKVTEMQQIRRKISLKNAKLLDNFGDLVITSSYVIGAKIIIKFLKEKKKILLIREENKQRRRQGQLYKNFDKLKIQDYKKQGTLLRQNLQGARYLNKLDNEIKNEQRQEELEKNSCSSSSQSFGDSRINRKQSVIQVGGIPVRTSKIHNFSKKQTALFGNRMSVRVAEHQSSNSLSSQYASSISPQPNLANSAIGKVESEKRASELSKLESEKRDSQISQIQSKRNSQLSILSEIEEISEPTVLQNKISLRDLQIFEQQPEQLFEKSYQKVELINFNKVSIATEFKDLLTNIDDPYLSTDKRKPPRIGSEQSRTTLRTISSQGSIMQRATPNQTGIIIKSHIEEMQKQYKLKFSRAAIAVISGFDDQSSQNKSK